MPASRGCVFDVAFLGRNLSGVLAKSGPLDFVIKNSFPLFFVCEKGLVHMYQNRFIYFPIFYFCFATSQKPILPATGFPAVTSSETQGQIVGRGKVGTGKKIMGEEKSRAKREAPGENVSPE